jgi:hypothetical protein
MIANGALIGTTVKGVRCRCGSDGAASGEEIDDIDAVARPEDVAAEQARFAALKELLMAPQLGTA